MRAELISHHHTPAKAVRRVMIRSARIDDVLRVTFRVPGPPARLGLRSPSRPRRVDDLWEQTCFECFIRAGRGPAYLEYNLSPSTEWAIYSFDDYRSGRTDADLPVPVIKPSIRDTRLELSARLWIPPLAALDWHVGLSAVIEEADGTKSYWALAHPPGAPDFHHPDCFALELPAPPNSSPRA